MHISYERFHHEVANATRVVFIVTAICVGLAMVSAWLGNAHAVVTFRGAAMSVGYAFAILFTLLIVSFAIGALLRWKDRRRPLHQ